MAEGSVVYVLALPATLGVVALRRPVPWTLIALVAIAHLVVLADVALFPIPLDTTLRAAGRSSALAPPRIAGLNLVPFRTIGPVLAGHAPAVASRIAILNIFVLTPAGSYLPLLFPTLRSWRWLVPVAIVGGMSIELAQLSISVAVGFTYRAIDIDDVLLNTIGIVVGWLVVRAAARAWRWPGVAG